MISLWVYLAIAERAAAAWTWLERRAGVYAPRWTAAEIAAIDAKSAEYDEFFDDVPVIASCPCGNVLLPGAGCLDCGTLAPGDGDDTAEEHEGAGGDPQADP